ncbi:MAG: chemotaxis protein CheC [bacterium]
MDELRFDILGEAGNIGAAHAATALGQLVERTVMIEVTRVEEATDGALPALAGPPDALAAGVTFHIVGDAGGRILLWLSRDAAVEMVDLLSRRPIGSTKALNEMGHSAVKEAGNIMASAYLTGLCDFSGLLLMPSVPSLLFDRSGAVMETAADGVERKEGKLLCVANRFQVLDSGVSGCLFFFFDAGGENLLVENAAGAF